MFSISRFMPGERDISLNMSRKLHLPEYVKEVTVNGTVQGSSSVGIVTPVDVVIIELVPVPRRGVLQTVTITLTGTG